MGRGALVGLGGALALGIIGAPSAVTAQNSVEVARARQVVEDYTACERTRRFVACWALLSKRAQAEWARQGRGTVADYADARSAAEPRYVDFRVMQIRPSPSRIVFVMEATRSGAPDGPRDRVEYAILREGDRWRMDGRRVGQSETTP